MAAQEPEEGDEEKSQHNSWGDLLRKMLPEGAPLPDEDQLDYSMSFDYIGPSPFYTPKQSVIKNPATDSTKFAKLLKFPLSLSPQNPTRKCHSASSSSDIDIIETSIDSNNDADDGEDEEEDHICGDQGFEGDYDLGCGVSELRAGDGCRRFSDESNKDDDRGFPSDRKTKAGNKCTRCGKEVFWWGKRVVCIVCGSVYCKNCVLKAMGDMPEGRKCVGCIGKAINESKRCRLGKRRKLLKRLISRDEVKRVVEAERKCRANRVRAHQVFVNGRLLSEDELDVLLGCCVPMKDLRPGRYWYDKFSGLWGKEGEKPDRIISVKLDVGGKLQADASGGNTGVYVNGREITRIELRLFKLAKVQCPRNTHLWLYEDGSYEEEGQNNIRGCIWEKASIRLLCSLFSLPVPLESARYGKWKDNTSYLVRHHQNYVHKLLLLGLEGSGTSTIFKQANFLYAKKFTPDRLQQFKLIIQSNTYRYLCVLLEGREHFEAQFLANKGNSKNDKSTSHCPYSVNQKIKDISDWILDLAANGNLNTYFPASAREYAPIIHEIWKHCAIQETYKRREELQFIPGAAKYFLDQVIEISSNQYEPSERDILTAEGLMPVHGLDSVEFSFSDSGASSFVYDETFKDPLKYQLVQLCSNNGCKWLDRFEDTNSIIFCVSLIDYNQMWRDTFTDLAVNKMISHRDYFKRLAANPYLSDKQFVLLLNKYDLFEDMIDRVPITVCEWFEDFNPVKVSSKNPSLANQAYYYIAMKFKEFYASITGNNKKLYVCQTQAVEKVSVDEAFRYVREIVKWELELKCGDNRYAFVGNNSNIDTD